MGRVLALDYGDVKIGVALSDPMKIIAKPLKVILNSSLENVLIELKELIESYEVEKIIVGLPITLKNRKSIQTNKVIAFISFITKRISIKIESYDERLTSKIATQSLIFQGVKTGHNKQEIDKTAAAIFLQNYLDEFKK